MNNKLFFLLSFCLVILASCGGDDCVAADWVGTYTGTQSCEGVDEDEAWSVVITAGADEETILVDGDSVTIDGCKANGSLDLGELGNVDYELELDGNTITGSLEGTVFGEPQDCTVTGTK